MCGDIYAARFSPGKRTAKSPRNGGRAGKRTTKSPRNGGLDAML